MTPAATTEPIPQSAAWLFSEYASSALNSAAYTDIVIERILERGSWEELRWLFVRYGEPRRAQLGAPAWLQAALQRSFALWRLALEVDDYVAPEWARAAKRMETW